MFPVLATGRTETGTPGSFVRSPLNPLYKTVRLANDGIISAVGIRFLEAQHHQARFVIAIKRPRFIDPSVSLHKAFQMFQTSGNHRVVRRHTKKTNKRDSLNLRAKNINSHKCFLLSVDECTHVYMYSLYVHIYIYMYVSTCIYIYISLTMRYICMCI